MSIRKGRILEKFKNTNKIIFDRQGNTEHLPQTRIFKYLKKDNILSVSKAFEKKSLKQMFSFIVKGIEPLPQTLTTQDRKL